MAPRTKAKKHSLKAKSTLHPDAPSDPPSPNMVWIPGGDFTMGSNDFYPEEKPERPVKVRGFWMDQFQVTNRDFERFVKETGYVTYSERDPDPAMYPGALPGMLVPGSLVFNKPKQRVPLWNPDDWRQWWTFQAGADWRHPTGPDSDIRKLAKHPVVHVAYEDAEAYAKWAGKTLATEAQWEFAARGGLEKAPYVWGKEFAPNGEMMANTWQGEFPWQNFKEDGFESTSPVGTFPANGYGLYDMAGNVWEWTQDWFIGQHEAPRSPCCAPENPRGPRKEESYDPAQPHIKIPRKVIKGGSHLCAPNYCLRYRPAARSPEMIDSSACHLGFRCVVNVTT